MTGQMLYRYTGQTSRSGRKVAVVLGVIGLDDEERKLYKDGHKYDVMDILCRNPEDITELNERMSPDDLLEEEIWRVK